jgi:hypothetical protein
MTRTLTLPKPIAEIFRQVARLERAYPGRKFTPDGHLIGSIGEVIAAEAFDLKLLPASAAGHDARDENGALVQIKLTSGNSVGLRANCERLLVMRIVDPTSAELVYNGPGEPVWTACGKMQKNGQRSISLTKLRSIT